MNIKKNIFNNFLLSAEENPHHVALYYQNKKITYKELLNKVYRVANYFNSINLKNDDVITLVSLNTPEAIASFLASSMMDLKIHLLHPLIIENNLIKELKEKKSKLLITMSIFLNKYKNVLNLNIPIYVLNPTSSLNSFKQFVFNTLNKKTLDEYIKNKKIAKYDDFTKTYKTIKNYSLEKGRVYLSSGGTEGKAKTIVLSDFAILSLIDLFPTLINFNIEEAKTIVMLGALPMFHGFGLVIGILAPLIYGGAILLMIQFHSKDVIKALRKNRLNILIGVPLIYEALLKNNKFNYKILKNIDVCFVGGDFISPSLLNRFNARLIQNESKAKLFEGYGLTETVTVLAVNTMKNNRLGSVGKPLKGIKVKILDNHNTPLKALKQGEIAVSGPTLMNGYLFEETNFIYIDNEKYIKTGDVGYLDNDNYLYFISRIKRIIKKRGFNIFPLAIEKFVSTLDGINECAYLNINNKEATYLFINPKKNKDEKLLKELINIKLKDNFEPYEIPDNIIFTTDFKKTNVGKIDYIYLSSLVDN